MSWFYQHLEHARGKSYHTDGGYTSFFTPVLNPWLYKIVAVGCTLLWPITAVLKSVLHKTVLYPINSSWVIQKPLATSWKTLQSWSGIEIKFVSSCILGNHQKSMKTVFVKCVCAMHQPPPGKFHHLSFHQSISSPSIHQASDFFFSCWTVDVWADLWHYDIAWWSLRSILCRFFSPSSLSVFSSLFLFVSVPEVRLNLPCAHQNGWGEMIWLMHITLLSIHDYFLESIRPIWLI